jgi:hypothetical protein
MRIIKLRFQNGLTFEDFKHEVFDVNGIGEHYIFEESSKPDFIIFGPYGNDIPEKSDGYTRIGYFCENIKPDMSACEWAFGVPREEEINHPRYKRIQWHGVDPQSLVKPAEINPDEIIRHKTKFCNFLYSHRVPYREKFFKALSKYKKVDAPGKSMNNMPSIDELYPGDIWQRKRQFLQPYKFTIAFENYVYPGYQTEKLYDAMQVNSLPIYCGDPFISDVFNTRSFVNAADYLLPNRSFAIIKLEKYSQPDFSDIRPSFYKAPVHRIKRKLKSVGRSLKLNYEFRNMDFQPLIDRIIELDRDQDKYIEVLKQPWFVNNEPPASASLAGRWTEIFENVKQQ